MTNPIPRRGFHLLDLASLVVGYSLASMLARALWPVDGTSDPGILIALSVAYAWLGMAMSGPIVLLFHRRAEPASEDEDLPTPRTWAELAWLIIGFYWIGMTLLIVPVRIRETRLVDSAILGVFPILAALVLRFLGPKRLPQPGAPPAWTHHAAIGLLVTWPIAWVTLILVGKTLL